MEKVILIAINERLFKLGLIKEFVQNDLDKEILVEAPLGLTFPSREIGFVCN